MRVNLIEEAILEHWGERCTDYQRGCPCCDAWQQLDKLKKAAKTNKERAK